jgi:ribosome biogenesis protein SSF1/2
MKVVFRLVPSQVIGSLRLRHPPFKNVSRAPPSIMSVVDKRLKAQEECMTFVVHTGEIGETVRELETEIRCILSPYTYNKLRVTRKNKIRDFTEAAGDLQAKMMILLRNFSEKMVLSINRFPRGPTVHFDVLRFTLMKDIRDGFRDEDGNIGKAALFNKTQAGNAFPILEGFTDSDEDETLVGLFQGLFPSLDLATADLSIMKRAVLFSKGPDGVISIRHYTIDRRDTSKSIALQNIEKGKIKDLGNYQSIEEYFEKTQKAVPKKKNICTIGLREIGPRIDMKLDYVELNLFDGMKLQEQIKEKKRKFYEKQEEMKRMKPGLKIKSSK